ncbi:CobW family GTP-binding protein [Falsibacillus pallidus]|uniref:G3E family GTPase n=1 Tax=Falsibacillus pallidus TaxID=493781 RepID=A0A370GH33_9BACI|nr:GTP-binding protein [Falsibacillus pallidus]RDI43108.1 G3E family GTPase [Falsibacillus pallidus]
MKNSIDENGEIMKKIKVYVLAGFLGSGKTTLLRNFIQYEKNHGRTPAILMNELGSVSIDTGAVEEGTPIAELLDGCICCTIQEKLEAQLQELLYRYQFDTLIIETTGAAHPVEVVDSIMSPLFAHQFDFEGIITTVDALRWKNRSELSPQVLHLLREQIRNARLVLLNKIDLVSEMENGTFVYEIQGLNSDATVVLTKHSAFDLDILSKVAKKEIMTHDPSPIGEKFKLQSFVHTFTGPIQLESFENWLKSLPDTIYRLKGYVLFTHSDKPYLFQYSYGMPLYFKEDMMMPLNLVIIGESLDKNHLQASLTALENNEENI